MKPIQNPIKSFFTVELREPSSEIGIIELEKEVPIQDINRMVEHAKNCVFITEKDQAFIVCGGRF